MTYQGSEEQPSGGKVSLTACAQSVNQRFLQSAAFFPIKFSFDPAFPQHFPHNPFKALPGASGPFPSKPELFRFSLHIYKKRLTGEASGFPGLYRRQALWKSQAAGRQKRGALVLEGFYGKQGAREHLFYFVSTAEYRGRAAVRAGKFRADPV